MNRKVAGRGEEASSTMIAVNPVESEVGAQEDGENESWSGKAVATEGGLRECVSESETA
jgi:hypothetical protein